MKVVVDSNIVLDYLLKREPFCHNARKLMLLGYVKEVELWLSVSQVADVFYVLSEGGKARLAQDAQAALIKLRTFIRISSLNELDFDELLDSPWTDLEDSCVHHSALKVKADCIVTRDKHGFKKSTVPVLTAGELFERLRAVGKMDYEEILLDVVAP